MDRPPENQHSLENERLKRENEQFRHLQMRYQQAMRDLREKEEFNFALFQYSPAAMVVVDHEGRVVKTNVARRHAGDRLPNIGDVMYRDYAAHHRIDMHAALLKCMHEGTIGYYPDMRYNNKFLSITIAPFPKGAIITSQNVTDAHRAELDRINLIKDLQRALNEVETLRGLLPICASCKNIRDDQGYWNTIEDYFMRRTAIDFSHTVCPDCMKKLYPDLWEQIKEKQTAAPA